MRNRNRYRKPEKRAAFEELLEEVTTFTHAELNEVRSRDYERANRRLHIIAVAHGLAGYDLRDVVSRARMVERGRRLRLKPRNGW